MYSFSYLCMPCALGNAREKLDGSPCIFTCCLINPIISRWLVRSAYQIPGSSCDDCIYGLFCPCCVTNQVYQTTKRYRNPSNDGGKQFNTKRFEFAPNTEPCCSNCLYTFFCYSCSIGSSLNRAMGMPFCLGCCCVNVCTARNLMRYQYRIYGDDVCDDCYVPFGIVCASFVCSSFFPFIWIISAPYFIALTMQLVTESKGRSEIEGNGRRYLEPHERDFTPATAETYAYTSNSAPPMADVIAINPISEHYPLKSNT